MADKRLTRLMHMEALILSKDYFAVGQGRILGTLFDQADKCLYKRRDSVNYRL